MSSLSFDFSDDYRPLAARMRPRNLAEYIGQSHLIGEGKPLRRAIEAGHSHSMIFWGPPGTGKTTLAEIIAHHFDAEVERLSAVTSGVKEIREAVERAKNNRQSGRRTLLFVDEVHRFNKSQQDAFLPHIEDGTIIFIGATTENPSFELNNALLSRARIYILKPLQAVEIEKVLQNALTDKERGLGNETILLEDNVIALLADYVNGDARFALNCLELMSDMAEVGAKGKIFNKALLTEVLGEQPLNGIVEAVKSVLEQCPPELAADIFERGMVLTGGGALLQNLDVLLSKATGVTVIVAEDPLTCVARGGGKALDMIDMHGGDVFSNED